MSIAIDLTDRRFGRLKVLEKTEQKNKCGVRLWRCVCDCGKEILSVASTLNSGRKLSCGCIREEQAIKPDDRFGMLTVVEATGERGTNGHKLYLCECQCGGKKKATAFNLRRGRTTHCGCQTMPEDLTGQRFGRLIVIGLGKEKGADGKRLWRCKCDCGGEKLVLSNSLKNGSTKSCGCLYHESKVKIGGQYGKLLVLNRTDNKNGKAMFLCICDCGIEKEYPSMWLLHGRVTSCGCSQGVTPVDLTGKRFGRLTALSPTDSRDSGAVVWKCVCDCGNIAYRCHSSLKASGENTNCGCLQPEISKENMKKAIHRVDNTVIEKLESKKPTVRNTSGIRGVYFNTDKQKWRATIGFQKKQIYLGEFDSLEAAAAVREQAEDEIYKPFLEKYYAGQQQKSEEVFEFEETISNNLKKALLKVLVNNIRTLK